jgi:hypothetical protein
VLRLQNGTPLGPRQTRKRAFKFGSPVENTGYEVITKLKPTLSCKYTFLLALAAAAELANRTSVVLGAIRGNQRFVVGLIEVKDHEYNTCNGS